MLPFPFQSFISFLSAINHYVKHDFSPLSPSLIYVKISQNQTNNLPFLKGDVDNVRK
jgi:hypothetical protein